MQAPCWRVNMCSRLGAALCVGGGTLLLLSMQHYASHHGSRQARPFHGEAHQQVEVDSSLKALRGLAPTVRGGRAVGETWFQIHPVDEPSTEFCMSQY